MDLLSAIRYYINKGRPIKNSINVTNLPLLDWSESNGLKFSFSLNCSLLVLLRLASLIRLIFNTPFTLTTLPKTTFDEFETVTLLYVLEGTICSNCFFKLLVLKTSLTRGSSVMFTYVCDSLWSAMQQNVLPPKMIWNFCYKVPIKFCSSVISDENEVSSPALDSTTEDDAIDSKSSFVSFVGNICWELTLDIAEYILDFYYSSSLLPAQSNYYLIN